MLNIVEIENRPILFITNKQQLVSVLNKIKNNKINNSVLILDVSLAKRQSTLWYSALINSLTVIRKHNVSVIGFTNGNTIDKRIEYLTDRKTVINNNKQLITIKNLIDGKELKMKGEL